jgi:beta-aspartyl-peptidase (threonine type)
MPRIIVHGGSGRITDQEGHRKGVRRAIRAGHALLQDGGSALDAAVKAVVTMEDDPTFNCGTGSALSLDGRAEMDAAVMLDDRSCGAVAAIEGVKNPVLVARDVMEQTDHVLLVGPEAGKFARRMGCESYDPITEHRKKQRAELIEKLKSGEKPRYFDKLTSFIEKDDNDTVGAIAMDRQGRIAVAASTGGILLHLPGRVGDTPVFGTGTYADERGGVLATGHGEEIIKLMWAFRTADFMEKLSAQEAVDRALQQASQYGCTGGLIAMDRKGNVAYGFNSQSMSYAYVVNEQLVVF